MRIRVPCSRTIVVTFAAALSSIACGSSDGSDNGQPTDGGLDGDTSTSQDSTTNGDSTHPPTDAPTDSTHADVPPGDAPHPGDIIDPSRVTTWNPGILADGQLHLPLGPDGLPTRSTICASPSPSADLQAAIDGCAEGQVVQLQAGTYTISSTITITKGIVLRGKGSGAGGTTIKQTGGGSVLAIGTSQDQICYASSFDTVAPLAEDAVKETTRVHVGSGAASLHAGDLAVIDELDDAAVDEGDCPYFKRVDHRSTSERVEVASVDAAAGVITLTTPLHWTFRSDGAHGGQIARVAQPAIKWAGIESVLLQGGTNPGYDGQMAGGIDISNAAYCWVKDVQTDDTIAGMHVAMRGTYRCVVRDSYFHHSADYGFGHDCYGVVIACGAADDLVENDVVRYMNKPILFNVSGGGNVVGYNYVDNSWATPPEWQEVNIDTHCAFPHMELIEGNYAPHVGATITHGNAGYLTFFRNYSSGQFAAPPVAGFSGKQSGNMEAIQFQKGDVDMNVVGCVLGSDATNDLGTAPVSASYVSTSSDVAGIYSVDDTADVEWTSVFAHGNYDTVTPGVVWDPKSSVRTLPPSLYLSSAPAWWPSGSAWPWAGSDLSPRVGTLPAKTRAP